MSRVRGQVGQWISFLEEKVENGDGGSEARPKALAESGHVEVARHEDERNDYVDDGDGLGSLDHVADAAAAARHADTHRGDPCLNTLSLSNSVNTSLDCSLESRELRNF